MNKLDIEKKIEEIILQIRPYINDDGGDIEFIKYEDNYVFVKFYGSCINCMYKDYTIQDNLYNYLVTYLLISNLYRRFFYFDQNKYHIYYLIAFYIVLLKL